MKAPFLLGRIFYGGFFLYSGINHFKEFKKLSQYTASKNIPFPEVAVGASGALLVLGGMSILLGVKPKLGSVALLAFLASASPTMHDFWNAGDPQQRQNDMIHFMKNLALSGSALALMGIEEPWPSSMPIPRIAAGSTGHSTNHCGASERVFEAVACPRCPAFRGTLRGNIGTRQAIPSQQWFSWASAERGGHSAACDPDT